MTTDPHCRHEKTIRARSPATNVHRNVCLACGKTVGDTFSSKWFVMLVDGMERKRPIPMVNDDDIALFESEDEAIRLAKANPLGAAFGYEVYEWLPR